MFKVTSVAAEFSAWDENGVPTLDKDGQEVAKSRRKKLQKEWDAQNKLHLEFLKEMGGAAQHGQAGEGN